MLSEPEKVHIKVETLLLRNQVFLLVNSLSLVKKENIDCQLSSRVITKEAWQEDKKMIMKIRKSSKKDYWILNWKKDKILKKGGLRPKNKE